MSGKDDLDSFLKKIDDVGSLIKELNSGEDEDKTEAMQKADEFLKAHGAKETGSDSFNRTMINKIKDPPAQAANKSEMGKEAFMEYVERDSKERTERRNENIKSSLVWKEKGNTSFKASNYPEAVDCYTKAISLAPDQHVYYSNRAQAYIKMGKPEKAIEDCEIGMKLEAKNIKLNVHKGRALIDLNKFEEATNLFNNILKIDKKQQKLVAEYLAELDKRRNECAREKEASILLQRGDKHVVEMKMTIEKLRKGFVSDVTEAEKVLSDLTNLMESSGNHQTTFRQLKGFNVFSENQTLKNMIKQGPDTISTHHISIIAMLSSAALDNEENCNIICTMENVLHLSVEIIEKDNTLNGRFESVQFLHRLSQYQQSRKLLIKNTPLERLLGEVLMQLGSGGDLTLVALGMINNLALEKHFVTDFEGKLSTDFIPGVVKMMDLLCLPIQQDERISRNLLPVINTSVTTVANLFRNPIIRKRFKDQQIWKTSIELLEKYCNELNDENKEKVVQSTFGMLMNLSIDPVLLKEDTHSPLIDVSKVILSSKDRRSTVQERCCGLWNHVLKQNDELTKKVVDKQLHGQFIDVIKNGSTVSRKYMIKCLALLTNTSEEVCQCLDKRKGIPSLLHILSTSKDEVEIGNTALCFAHLCKYKSIAISLVDCGLIRLLLTHATNGELPKNVRHNCAVAIGKFALVDERFLQQVRDLRGMEILHEVMRENKMV